jgi:uncharacterized protein YqhQ
LTEKMPMYGGQAVIEGVMMRGAAAWTVAVRAPDSSIRIDHRQLGAAYRGRLAKAPFIRGLFVLWDAIVLGTSALSFSANVQAGEENKIEGAPLTLTILFSLAVGIGVFFLLPVGAAYLIGSWTSWPDWSTNLIEGLIRLVILILYIWGIGFIPDIARVYGYHGAEHMTINAFEEGSPLTVDDVLRYSRLHPRCGTAFLLTVVVASILVFSLLGPLALLPRLVSRLVLLPVLASLAYEYIRLSSRFPHSPLFRLLVAPNLALQELTTRPPEPAMVEVAIAAFRALRSAERPEPAPN